MSFPWLLMEMVFTATFFSTLRTLSAFSSYFMSFLPISAYTEDCDTGTISANFFPFWTFKTNIRYHFVYLYILFPPFSHTHPHTHTQSSPNTISFCLAFQDEALQLCSRSGGPRASITWQKSVGVAGVGPVRDLLEWLPAGGKLRRS